MRPATSRSAVRYALAAAGALALTAGCGGAANGPGDGIGAAAVAFVRENGGVPGTAVVEEVSGDHARARVTPERAGSTGPAWVFLRREDGRWQGVLYGTAFRPEDYLELGIPASLRVE